MYALYLALLSSIGLVFVAALADVLIRLSAPRKWQRAARSQVDRHVQDKQTEEGWPLSIGEHSSVNDDTWRLTA